MNLKHSTRHKIYDFIFKTISTATLIFGLLVGIKQFFDLVVPVKYLPVVVFLTLLVSHIGIQVKRKMMMKHKKDDECKIEDYTDI